MKESICIRTLILLGMVLLIVLCSEFSVFGQRPLKCEVNDLPKPRMKIASEYSSSIVGIRVAIKPKYQTDLNLILMAQYIRKRYCEEKSVIVLVFDNKRDARSFTVYEIKQIPDTNRAIYTFDKVTGKEELVRIKMVNERQVEIPILLPE